MKTEAEIERILTRPLPTEAIKPPNNKGLSSIKNIYVTERLNEAYGRGQWSLKSTDMGAEMWMQKTTKGEREMYTGKAHVRITLPNGTELECIATSQNDDEGDASKGAISDCISKIGSWLGIGSHIWKGQTLEQAWAEWNALYAEKPAPPTIEEELAKFNGKYSTMAKAYAQALGKQFATPATAEEAKQLAEALYKEYYF